MLECGKFFFINVIFLYNLLFVKILLNLFVLSCYYILVINVVLLFIKVYFLSNIVENVEIKVILMV